MKKKISKSAKIKKPAVAKVKTARTSKPKAVAATVAVKPKETVAITAAKGRPMLSWVGKRPLRHVTAFPAQHIESFNPAGEPADKGGLLFHGDNKEVLAHLLANGFRGKVNLIYIDPPFDSGADYVRKVSLRGPKGTTKFDGESYALGEQIQYTDIWANDNYLQFMFERLMLLKELLAVDGSIYVHCDARRSHFLRCVLDEVFGQNAFENEIIWKRTTARSDSDTYNHIHDAILFYRKGEKIIWNPQWTAYSAEYLKSNFKPDKHGKLFRDSPLTAPGTRTGPSGQPWRGTDPTLMGRGRHWAIPDFVRHLLSEEAKENTQRALDELDKLGRIIWGKEGKGRPNVVQFVDDVEGVELQSIWSDFSALSSNAEESEEYPTQKPEALLERIVKASSNPDDLMLDVFLGAGTTAAVAQRLGRRWIGCDINKGAIQTTAKRLQNIIAEQIESQKTKRKQQELIADDKEKLSPPAQLSFAVHRVNDYDLAIQHNEAINLACEHIGITRTRADSYFDGTQGQRLAKVIPFGHPLSLTDLEDLKRELEARSNEERDVVVVCLGKELSVDGWLEDWNRLRKRGDVPNKIEVIELRTDPKYGKFMAHQPAQAKVNIARKGENIAVEIDDFISPTILERLQSQAGLLNPKIDDWRAVVDCVMIDPAYNGKVFNIALADVPEKKTDFVQGKYELPAPKGKTSVAVKITDMLGEEVLAAKVV
jgi:adenine-specific DNA-methyltransferase